MIEPLGITHALYPMVGRLSVEIAPNDRVIFEKIAESRFGVLNGYTGTVLAVAEDAIEVELDVGRRVCIGPKAYPHLDYGWSTTTHRQGRGDPLVIPTLAKNDDVRSAHVALTRCETRPRVHTRLDRDELLSPLSSPTSLRPKDDSRRPHRVSLGRATGLRRFVLLNS